MSTVKSQKALSLVEVLIAVAILTILLLLALRQFNGELGRAKDGQRKEDLRQLKLALENYYNDHNKYPPAEYLSDCGGTSLHPYLRLVPCDPITKQPYIYLPEPSTGTAHAYRILSKLSNSQDPVVTQLGCEGGCGIPGGHPLYGSSTEYIYGVAEGMPVSFNNDPPLISPSADSELNCSMGGCYCCGGTNQNCNVYVAGYGSCLFGPFATADLCNEMTPCQP